MSTHDTTQTQRTNPIRNRARRRFLVLASATAALALSGTLGCATGTTPGASAGVDVRPEPTPQAHATIAEAAHAALEQLHDTPYGRDRRAMIAGPIVETADGYVWLPPSRSEQAGRSVVRMRIEERQVATFVAHPRTGNDAVDRANEAVTRAERRLVDEYDRAHRPIFVLTPRGKILAYRHEGEVLEIADLRRDRSLRGVANGADEQVAGLDR